jgi:hypothetical protein
MIDNGIFCFVDQGNKYLEKVILSCFFVNTHLVVMLMDLVIEGFNYLSCKYNKYLATKLL